MDAGELGMDVLWPSWPPGANCLQAAGPAVMSEFGGRPRSGTMSSSILESN